MSQVMCSLTLFKSSLHFTQYFYQMCNLDQLITLVLQYAMMIQNNKNIVKNGKKNERLLLWMWIS